MGRFPVALLYLEFPIRIIVKGIFNVLDKSMFTYCRTVFQDFL